MFQVLGWGSHKSKVDQALAKKPFEDVVKAELSTLYRVAVRLCRNETTAEDLVAQTLFLAAKGWQAFDGNYPRSWMIRIMRNEYASAHRKVGSGPTVSIDEVSEPYDDLFWREIDWNISGSEIGRALDAIPEENRLAVVMCDMESLTRDEAAEALGVPVGTLNSRLHRGRNMLRAKLVAFHSDFQEEN
jgi:RNA polymerase sigma-70 factor (ECF subfamily)